MKSVKEQRAATSHRLIFPDASCTFSRLQNIQRQIPADTNRIALSAYKEKIPKTASRFAATAISAISAAPTKIPFSISLYLRGNSFAHRNPCANTAAKNTKPSAMPTFS